MTNHRYRDVPFAHNAFRKQWFEKIAAFMVYTFFYKKLVYKIAGTKMAKILRLLCLRSIKKLLKVDGMDIANLLFNLILK